MSQQFQQFKVWAQSLVVSEAGHLARKSRREQAEWVAAYIRASPLLARYASYDVGLIQACLRGAADKQHLRDTQAAAARTRVARVADIDDAVLEAEVAAQLQQFSLEEDAARAARAALQAGIKAAEWPNIGHWQRVWDAARLPVYPSKWKACASCCTATHADATQWTTMAADPPPRGPECSPFMIDQMIASADRLHCCP